MLTKSLHVKILMALCLSGAMVSMLAGWGVAQRPSVGRPQSRNAGASGVSSETPLITEGVTFAPTQAFDKDQRLRYESQSSMTLYFQDPSSKQATSTPSTRMNAILAYKVQDIKSDGSAQVSVVSEGGSMEDAGGVVQKLAKEPDTAARILNLDRLSRIIAFRDQSETQASGGLASLLNQLNLLIPLQILPLPTKTIRVGESWSALYAMSGKWLTTGKLRDTSKKEAKKENQKEAKQENKPELDDVAQEETQEAVGGEAMTESRRNIKATMTLLGIEKIGTVDTIKIRQVLSIPTIIYTDARGKITDARNAKGRMVSQLIFTQLVNALPQNGLLVRSVGNLGGKVSLEGSLAGKVLGNTLTLGGKVVVVRLEDEQPAETPK